MQEGQKAPVVKMEICHGKGTSDRVTAFIADITSMTPDVLPL
jgi:hypothetical protein